METLYATRDPELPGRLCRRPIVDVMKKPPPTVSTRSPLHETLAMMVRRDISHIVAVDDKGRCAGVLSGPAVAAAWAMGHSPLSRRNVASALDARPAVIPTRFVVSQAAQLMHATGVDAVAVADPRGNPVGIVTGADLVALLTGHANPEERG